MSLKPRGTRNGGEGGKYRRNGKYPLERARSSVRGKCSTVRIALRRLDNFVRWGPRADRDYQLKNSQRYPLGNAFQRNMDHRREFVVAAINR